MLLKIKWLFFMHCLVCYLKVSKKHILTVNKCMYSICTCVYISPFTVYM